MSKKPKSRTRPPKCPLPKLNEPWTPAGLGEALRKAAGLKQGPHTTFGLYNLLKMDAFQETWQKYCTAVFTAINKEAKKQKLNDLKLSEILRSIFRKFEYGVPADNVFIALLDQFRPEDWDCLAEYPFL